MTVYIVYKNVLLTDLLTLIVLGTPNVVNSMTAGVEFVPMIWGYWGQQFPALEYDTVLGFNEPNHSDQSDLDPESAAYAWLELQESYPDKTLVSPSASPPNTEEWFSEFFEICQNIGCRIDYLGTT